MPAYAEGDVADGPNGETAIFSGGKWVVQGSPQMPLPQGDDAAMKDLQTQATDAQWLAQKAQQFKALQNTPQRGMFGSQGPFASGPILSDLDAFGHNINFYRGLVGNSDPRLGELDSISNQAWAHMRPSGSGGLKAPEIEGFQQAFPNVDNYRAVNNGITDRLQDDAETAANKLQFIDNFIRSGHGTFADANAAWTNRATSIPAPVDSSKPLPNGPAPGTVEQGYRFNGGNPADPANWTQLNAQPTEVR